MKNIVFTFLLLTIIASCGKDNKVSSDSENGNAIVTPITPTLLNFEGSYDLIKMETNDCGASIRIVRDCNGYQLISNHTMDIEEFCNINKGEFRGNIRFVRETARDNGDRNPPNPDSKVNTTVVTQEGNQLQSVLRLSPKIAFTNTLTLTKEGILIKNSQLKSRTSRCVYQKR